MATIGHEVAEQVRPPHDRQLDAEGSGRTSAGYRWTDLVAGAVGGLVATGPMSVAMALLYRRLPWWQPCSLPPREITANVPKSIGRALRVRHLRASRVFAAGMIGTGLLAVPALSGSAGHTVAELFDWRVGFDTSWTRAKPFYAVIIATTLVGAPLSFTGVKPMAALYWTAVLNGVLAPPLLVLIMLAARDRHVMGEHPIGPCG
jgi:hypothetical protein